MTRSVDERLQRLRERRSGKSDELYIDGKILTESFEKRAGTNATRYALGAMQEVEHRYTQISIEEGERVKHNLTEGLQAKGMSASYHPQGSVPLNVHVKGVSDVDLLAVEPIYLAAPACPGSKKSYLPYTGLGTLQDDVLSLRGHCEEVLSTRFWGANVDTTPAKCIKLSEGSLRRDVDVVPACWHDSVLYQLSLDESERGIIIVNKHTRERITNYPFKYAAKINTKDQETIGGAKMAIRLLKNVKNDDEQELELSSYDIGSLIYHCPSRLITFRPGADLMVLSGTDEWLDDLARDYQYATQLETPDGTRKIIDTTAKWTSLLRLSQDVSELSDAVLGEIGGRLLRQSGSREVLRKQLNDHYIPLAA